MHVQKNKRYKQKALGLRLLFIFGFLVTLTLLYG
jgi:hypothetical protein